MYYKKIKNVKFRTIEYNGFKNVLRVYNIPVGYEFKVGRLHEYLFVVLHDPTVDFQNWVVIHKLTGIRMSLNYVFKTRIEAIFNAIENYHRAIKVHGSFNNALKFGIKLLRSTNNE
jgi:hypothetical protein